MRLTLIKKNCERKSKRGEVLKNYERDGRCLHTSSYAPRKTLKSRKMEEGSREAADNEGASDTWSSCTCRSSPLLNGDSRPRRPSPRISLPVSPRARPSSSSTSEGESARPSWSGTAGGAPLPGAGDRGDSATTLGTMATASGSTSGSGGRRRGGRSVGGLVMIPPRRGVGGPATMTGMKTRTKRKSLLGFGRRWLTPFGSSRYVLMISFEFFILAEPFLSI